ncbi:tumor necrosis factor alpha-induced protein 8 isoform X1 [Myotis daubentonii]|uniref:tumor necrosis factor alpha-induced protein 8 isoform X1 n=1 Tax=Myotis daubentonii TaxID=98922 RepID=UPI002872CFE2|nr:tumor necrosis factor alpha-induced protein 8 isoform X1 [Myotis daubentonii]
MVMITTSVIRTLGYKKWKLIPAIISRRNLLRVYWVVHTSTERLFTHPLKIHQEMQRGHTLELPVATDVFNSKNLAVQAQKKILGKMVSKSIATTLIDDTSSEVLDELYRVTREYTQNKKEAEKIIKNLIKTVLKLAILYRNNQFNQDELALMEKFKKKVHQLAMTVVSFHQVDYTFDRNVLSRLLNECRELLHQIIQRHLTAKSHGRINNVFDHFSDCDFLAALYNPFGNFKPHLKKLCDGVNKMLDEENI